MKVLLFPIRYITNHNFRFFDTPLCQDLLPIPSLLLTSDSSSCLKFPRVFPLRGFCLRLKFPPREDVFLQPGYPSFLPFERSLGYSPHNLPPSKQPPFYVAEKAI